MIGTPGACVVVRRRADGWGATGMLDFTAGVPPQGGRRAPFLQWHWDGSALHVTRDRYGIYPVFYWADRDTLALATTIDALLQRGAPATLDDEAIAVFLRLGFYLDDDTPFVAIKALPADASVDLSQAPSIVRTPRPHPPVNRSARTALIDGYVELFRAASVRRLHERPVVVPLSGGRDSRHILFALLEAGQPIATSVTARHFAPRPDEDAEVAARLAAAAGVRHVVLDEPRDRVATELIKNRLTSYCSDEHAQNVLLARYLDGAGGAVFDGIGGDVLSAGLFLQADALQALDAGPEPLSRFILDGYDTTAERGLQRLLGRAAKARFSRERAEARVRAALVPHFDAPSPLTSFFFWNRTRREIALAPCAIYPSHLTVEMPYLDDDLFDFLFGIPAEVVVDHQLHDEAIAAGYPQFAHVPYEKKGGGKSSPEYRRIALDFLREAFRRPALEFFDARYLTATLGREIVTGRGQLWYVPKGLALLQAASASAAARVS